MTDQTKFLIDSLPHFAAALRAADRRGTGPWEIVRWEGIEPGEVCEHHVRVVNVSELDGRIPVNRFDSRTPALNACGTWVKTHHPGNLSTEKGHKAVWRWKEDGKEWFQTVLPVNRPNTDSRPPNSVLMARGPASAVAGKGTVLPPPATATSGAASACEGKGTMVRVTEKGYSYLRRMADEDEKPLQTVLEEAIIEYDRKRFFEKADAAYRALRADPQAWAEEQRERADWDGTLMDGIDEDDNWRVEESVTRSNAQERRSA